MGTVVVWFLALGLALHIFETTMEIGATQENWGKKKALVMGVLYAGVQLLLMALGGLAACLMQKLPAVHISGRFCHYSAALLLLMIAVRRFRNGTDKAGFLERREDPLSVKGCILRSVRTGLEAVIIGICLYYGNGGALWGGICVLGLSVPGAVGGFLYGYWLGVKQKKVVCLTDAVFMTLAALGIFM
ncbi:hypothetical protein C3B58_01840 [Lactonifactor longoviformis]|uniref:Mn2+ efflux pump MntP n=1 Tax=Lactonifactor longoviformis DSM 17459 TaxID=1122155 RepID=A0A1M5AAU8_9CLOT|nr:hypothetical protein [Lactonifactor longoviformis]POP34653.1 hypothetical protein C3B58_01840 [Lactonifactor longoviformis]SHF27440.1 hypothetical protein SAMN02745158_03114 [Lactonifactor longoviformis DSM 17459]